MRSAEFTDFWVDEDGAGDRPPRVAVTIATCPSRVGSRIRSVTITASKNRQPTARPPAPEESDTAARGPRGRRRVARTLRIAPVYAVAVGLGAAAAIVTACASSTPGQSSTTGHAAAQTQAAVTASHRAVQATGVQTLLKTEDVLAAVPSFVRRTRDGGARQPARATHPLSVAAATTTTPVVVIPAGTTTTTAALVTPASTPATTVPAITPTTTTTTSAVPKTVTRVLYPSPGQTVSVTTRTVVASPGAEPTTQTTWRTTSSPVPKH